jgi:hypothetical protein
LVDCFHHDHRNRRDTNRLFSWHIDTARLKDAPGTKGTPLFRQYDSAASVDLPNANFSMSLDTPWSQPDTAKPGTGDSSARFDESAWQIRIVHREPLGRVDSNIFSRCDSDLYEFRAGRACDRRSVK